MGVFVEVSKYLKFRNPLIILHIKASETISKFIINDDKGQVWQRITDTCSFSVDIQKEEYLYGKSKLNFKSTISALKLYAYSCDLCDAYFKSRKTLHFKCHNFRKRSTVRTSHGTIHIVCDKKVPLKFIDAIGVFFKYKDQAAFVNISQLEMQLLEIISSVTDIVFALFITHESKYICGVERSYFQQFGEMQNAPNIVYLLRLFRPKGQTLLSPDWTGPYPLIPSDLRQKLTSYAVVFGVFTLFVGGVFYFLSKK